MNGYQFWKHIDEINPYGTVIELSKQMGVEYYALKQWRRDSRIPKAEDLYALAKALKKPMEFLLTGEEPRPLFSSRVMEIADRCMYTASNEDLMLIERILRIPSDFEAVEKEKRGRESSGKNSTTA